MIHKCFTLTAHDRGIVGLRGRATILIGVQVLYPRDTLGD